MKGAVTLTEFNCICINLRKTLPSTNLILIKQHLKWQCRRSVGGWQPRSFKPATHHGKSIMALNLRHFGNHDNPVLMIARAITVENSLCVWSMFVLIMEASL